MALRTYKAKFMPAVGGGYIEVTVKANDQSQARKLLEAQYGPIKSWVRGPDWDVKADK